jgi:hypothetical protein
MGTKTSKLPLMTAGQVDPANDYIAIVDASAGVTKRIKIADLIVGSRAISSGTAEPNGNVTATGPAIYFQSSANGTTVWYKNTSGTSNSEWGP